MVVVVGFLQRISVVLMRVRTEEGGITNRLLLSSCRPGYYSRVQLELRMVLLTNAVPVGEMYKYYPSMAHSSTQYFPPIQIHKLKSVSCIDLGAVYRDPHILPT